MKLSELKSWHQLRIKWYFKATSERKEYYSFLQQDRSHFDGAKEKCRRDLKWFINYFAWSYDPRNAEIDYTTTIPFWLTPHQEDYCDFLEYQLENGNNALTEKSRAEGMTWIWVYFATHRLLLHDGFKTGFGSYKESKVDHLGDLDSIFEKIRFNLRRMPKFLVGKSTRIDDNFSRIVNRSNGSAVTGEVGNDIGRGGRNSIYFVDEHASLENAQAVENALSENSNCIIYGSTPKGTNNLFYRKRTTMPSERIFTFHWKDNPLKNEEWYEYVDDKFDPITIAQEVDIDYTASVEGVVIPAKWVRSAVKFEVPDSKVVHAGADVGGGVGLSGAESVYIARKGVKTIKIESYRNMDTTDFAHKIAHNASRDNANKLIYDHIGVGAGISGTIRKMGKGMDFALIPFRSGSRPTKRKYKDAPDISAKERFANLRAEMWWSLRERFRITHIVAQKMKEDDLLLSDALTKTGFISQELISIPNDNELITQLSQPTMDTTSSGLILIESKKDMADRGIKSPDLADALVYCYSDVSSKKVSVPTTHSQKTMA